LIFVVASTVAAKPPGAAGGVVSGGVDAGQYFDRETNLAYLLPICV
jgi:hypothetical protein